jgi:translation initiation factor 3 subunit G|eukprot:scaffold500_cov210-Chaetoceros_neogracile.AAC.5
MAPPAEKRWGDDADDEDDFPLNNESSQKTTTNGVTIPPTHTSRVDSKGIKIVTSYRANPSNPTGLLKTITKIRVNTVIIKEHVDVEKRRNWKSFGQAAVDEREKNTNVTIQSRDDIFISDPNADTDLQDEDNVSKALAGNLNEFWAKQQRRQLERKYDVEAPGQNDADVANGWQKVGDKDAAAGGKYVPPSARGARGATGSGGLAAMANRLGDKPVQQDDRDQNTIRVTNISEDTSEIDLQELFQPFGRISRVYLAKDKETLQSRGFAFVSFVHREDAARAMDKLQGYGYDHLILKLEWARPSAPKNPGTEGTEFRSGYGKALAQDTKEKVSFASNLTR